MDSKACFKCLRTLPLSQFYPHPQMADGHLNKCKDCTKRDVRGWHRSKNGRAYSKRREQTPERKSAKLSYQRKTRASNPLRTKAHAAVSRAIRNGTLKRLPCQMCGNHKSQGHHEDYSRPLDVRWLCFKCHREFGHKQDTSRKGSATIPLPF